MPYVVIKHCILMLSVALILTLFSIEAHCTNSSINQYDSAGEKALFLISQTKFNEAAKVVDNEILEQTGFKPIDSNILLAKSMLLEVDGNHQESLIWYKRYAESKYPSIGLSSNQKFDEIESLKAQHSLQMLSLANRERNIKNMLLIDRRETHQKWNIMFLMGGFLLFTLLFYLGSEHRKRAFMQKLALTDPLTGTHNRRSILEKAEKAIAYTKSNVSIAILDLDHFKSINDNYGHDVGDAVLSQFVKTCEPLLRKEDRLGRYGGEEFLLILPDARKEDVQQIFNRLQEALVGQQYETEAGTIHLDVTISMGAVFSNERKSKKSKSKESLQGLIKSADELVYKAKHSGRNQLCLP